MVKITKHASKLLEGKTLVEDDHRIGGRWVGSAGPHKVTYCTTGGGKFTTEIAMNSRTHQGGGLAFSTKPEIRQFAKGYRPGVGYVFDPFSEDITTHRWNPLEEIDPQHPAARDMLACFVEAMVMREGGSNASSEHFLELSRKYIRSVIAFVLTDPEFDGMRHLGTVADLINKGYVGDEKYFCQKEFEKTLIRMSASDNMGGAVRDGSATLLKIGLRERGSILSTVARSIDFINSPLVRAAISPSVSDYSLRDIKRNEAWVYFTIPEAMLEDQSRLLRLKFSLGLLVCDSHFTPQPAGSQRQSLFIIDEAAQLGKPTMPPCIEQALTIKRSSYVKLWLVFQNYGQGVRAMSNPANITSSCDRSFYGIDPQDTEAVEAIKAGLGTFNEGFYEGKPGEATYKELTRELLSTSDIGEFLDPGSPYKLLFPINGRPARLKRYPYWKVVPKNKHGHVPR